MNTTLAFLGQFGGAIEFIFEERESVGGGVKVGGLGEISDLTATHLLVSAVAMAVACAISIPIGLYLGHKGRGEFAAISVSNVGRAVPAIVLLFFLATHVCVRRAPKDTHCRSHPVRGWHSLLCRISARLYARFFRT